MYPNPNNPQKSSFYALAENLAEWGKAHIKESQNNSTSTTSVSPIIAEVFTLLHADASEKNIILTNNTFQKVNVPVSKSIINFMILNLVNNSIRASNDGQIEVACETERNWLYISVKDSGIGMDFQQIEKILKSNRVKTDAVLNEPGSGIGLILINEFLQQLQGGMTIDSILTKGTTVKLSIPLNN